MWKAESTMHFCDAYSVWYEYYTLCNLKWLEAISWFCLMFCI